MAVLKCKNSNGEVKTVTNIKVTSDFDNKVFLKVKDASFDNGKTRALVAQGKLVKITANEVLGMFFSYFIDEEGKIVSYDKNFNTHVNTDKIYRAVYSTEEVEAQPIVYFTNGVAVPDECKIVFNMSCRIPDNYEKTEWGICLSPFSNTEDSLVYGGDKVVATIDRHEATKTARNADVVFTWSTDKSVFDNCNTLYCRAYAKIKKDEVEEIIYSDILSVHWE